MVHPYDAHRQKGRDVGDQLRPLAEERGEQLSRRHLGDRELEYQKGDRDCEDAVGKSLDPGGVHATQIPAPLRGRARVGVRFTRLWNQKTCEVEDGAPGVAAPRRPRPRRLSHRPIMTRRSPDDLPPPPGLNRLVTPPILAPHVTYFLKRSSTSWAIPIRSPRVSSRKREMRPAAAPSFCSGVLPRFASGSVPRTTIWSSSTATSTPVNQPSGSLPANQPLIDPSSFSSMITILRNW